MSSDRGQQWYKELKKLKSDAKQAQTDLQRWELLGNQSAQKGGSTERSKLGAEIRLKFGKLKADQERVKRQLDALPESEVTQKTLTQWRDELAEVTQEITEGHQRATRKNSTMSTSSDLPSTSSFAAADGPQGGRGSGAELQPVSNRALLDQQKQAMRDIEDQLLTPLEGTVDSLMQVGREINREVTSQNRMLDDVNENVGRVQSRMSRVRDWVSRVGQQDRTRCLGCIVVVLFIILVVLLVKMIMP